eukprot:CAMPEP_0113477164 /NCGR_PEP_ID=MMETSP0014_2-20120614/20061_1 /TAXON_ID=2857 /ORGANISM="Nitzschia sp." /LENGTH=660 /DNA_ID=CAMNT_0000370239 /DNA_START=111 /DNA_END=2093 /DNA_ORIENTATION=+ /assembly_acc=CAM_ASM_000159
MTTTCTRMEQLHHHRHWFLDISSTSSSSSTRMKQQQRRGQQPRGQRLSTGIVLLVMVVTASSNLMGSVSGSAAGKTIPTSTGKTSSSSSSKTGFLRNTSPEFDNDIDVDNDVTQRQQRQQSQDHNNKNNDRTLITGGEDADPSQYPFFVRSSYDNVGFTLDIICGASLIHTDMILTAAHCQGAFNFGALTYRPQSQTFNRLRRVDMQRVHPSYHVDKTYINYDLMVIRLSDPVTDVTPVMLNPDPDTPSTSTRTAATGFGVTDYEAALASNGSVGGVPTNLKVGYFRPLTLEECSSRGRFSNVRIDEDVMCTDPWEDDSICSGDSGGPLTIPYSEGSFVDVEPFSSGTGSGDTVPQAIQVGISSFGTDCQGDEVPDGFVRVSYFREWIIEQICLMSRYPPSNCAAITGGEGDDQDGNQDQEDEEMVDIKLRFEHDFSVQETTFAVRNLVTNKIEISGPEYIPRRGEIVVSSFQLRPGRYTFEIYDQTGDGLRNPDFVSSQYPDGRWEMTAVYSNGARAVIGQGGPDFETEQITTIVVEGFSSDFTVPPTTAPTFSPTPDPTNGPPPVEDVGDSQSGNANADPTTPLTPDIDPDSEIVWSSGPFTPSDTSSSSDASSNSDIPWMYRVFLRSASSSPPVHTKYWSWSFTAAIATSFCLMMLD